MSSATKPFSAAENPGPLPMYKAVAVLRFQQITISSGSSNVRLFNMGGYAGSMKNNTDIDNSTDTLTVRTARPMLM